MDQPRRSRERRRDQLRTSRDRGLLFAQVTLKHRILTASTRFQRARVGEPIIDNESRRGNRPPVRAPSAERKGLVAALVPRTRRIDYGGGRSCESRRKRARLHGGGRLARLRLLVRLRGARVGIRFGLRDRWDRRRRTAVASRARRRNGLPRLVFRVWKLVPATVRES